MVVYVDGCNSKLLVLKQCYSMLIANLLYHTILWQKFEILFGRTEVRTVKEQIIYTNSLMMMADLYQDTKIQFFHLAGSFLEYFFEGIASFS